MSSGSKLVCRACGRNDLTVFLPLGEMPLANSYLTSEQLETAEERFVLDLAVCPGCSLVQLTETVPPEKMFSDYLYMSSISETMLAHAEALCGVVEERAELEAGARIVEVGSNDGYLLKFFRQRGYEVLGVDPAENLASVARENGVPTKTAFFSAQVADEILAEHGQADALLGNNVLAHVPDINGFAEGVARLLSPGGVAAFEFPYLRRLIDGGEFDTIYHEHVFYLSLTAVSSAFSRHGLVVEDVDMVEIHGGSLRVWLRPAAIAEPSAAAGALFREEETWVRDPEAYDGCRKRFADLRGELTNLLASIKADDGRIASYGAAAKGTMLTNLFEIGKETLDFVVDKNPLKQGRFMPGSRLPIVGPEQLLNEMPGHCLVLVWNLLDEVRRQQAEYVARGGRFIVPVPHPKIL